MTTNLLTAIILNNITYIIVISILTFELLKKER